MLARAFWLLVVGVLVVSGSAAAWAAGDSSNVASQVITIGGFLIVLGGLVWRLSSQMAGLRADLALIRNDVSHWEDTLVTKLAAHAVATKSEMTDRIAEKVANAGDISSAIDKGVDRVVDVLRSRPDGP